MLSEIMGEPIQNEYDFMKAVKSLAANKVPVCEGKYCADAVV